MMRWTLLVCLLALAGCDDTANGPDQLSEYLNRPEEEFCLSHYTLVGYIIKHGSPY